MDIVFFLLRKIIDNDTVVIIGQSLVPSTKAWLHSPIDPQRSQWRAI